MKRFVEWFDSLELSGVTIISKVVPLIVPMIPAYVGYTHVTTILGFDPFFGWVYAGVIEGLGYAAIYKAVQFWEYNKKYAAGSPNRAPLGMALIIYVVYLLVTLSVNVVLDWVSGVVWYKVLALGLISILSIPAGLLMSISAIQTERTNEREAELSRRRTERKNEQRTNTPNEQPENSQRTQRTNGERTPRRTNIPQPANRQGTNEPRTDGENEQEEHPFGYPTNERRESIKAYIERVQAEQNRTPGPSEISRALGVSKGYASDVMNGKA